MKRSLMTGLDFIRKAPVTVITVPLILFLLCVLAFSLMVPPGMEKRVTDLEAQVKQIVRGTKAEGAVTAFGPDVVCAGAFTSNAREGLNAAVAGSGLTLALFEVVETEATRTRPSLRTYAFSLKGHGSYEQVLLVLRAMDAFRPRIFLDSMALRNRVTDVEISIEGRMFCR